MAHACYRGQFIKNYNIRVSNENGLLLEAEAKRRGMPVNQLILEYLQPAFKYLKENKPDKEEWSLPVKTKTKRKVEVYNPDTTKDVKFVRSPRSDS